MDIKNSVFTGAKKGEIQGPTVFLKLVHKKKSQKHKINDIWALFLDILGLSFDFLRFTRFY